MKRNLFLPFLVLVIQSISPSYQQVMRLPITSYSNGWISLSADRPMQALFTQSKKKKLKTKTINVISKGYHVTVNGNPIHQEKILINTPQVTVNGISFQGPASITITPSSITVFAKKSAKKPHEIWHKAASKPNRMPKLIKVLIDEKAIARENAGWTLISNKGFDLYDNTQKKKLTTLCHKHLSIHIAKGSLFLNNIPVHKNTITIKPRDGYAGIDTAQYHGTFTIALHGDKLYLVNNVGLEEYVYSVLKTESWPGWPIEVNKVFAIASRSYVLGHINRLKKNKPLYHVKNTNEHQTYRGMHDTETIKKAVEQTKGVILSHNGAPALAMFDSCCGGIVPAHISDFEFEKAPYLARYKPCKHCKRCKIFSWKKEVPLDTAHKYLTPLFNDKAKISDISIIKKDKAGLVSSLNIKKGSKHLSIDGKKFYSAMKDIKSFCYTVKRSKDILIFEGRGYGHHIGLCQWGAREMVRDGWPYQRILSFFYPGTKLSNLVNL